MGEKIEEIGDEIATACEMKHVYVMTVCSKHVEYKLYGLDRSNTAGNEMFFGAIRCQTNNLHICVMDLFVPPSEDSRLYLAWIELREHNTVFVHCIVKSTGEANSKLLFFVSLLDICLRDREDTRVFNRRTRYVIRYSQFWDHSS